MEIRNIRFTYQSTFANSAVDTSKTGCFGVAGRSSGAAAGRCRLSQAQLEDAMVATFKIEIDAMARRGVARKVTTRPLRYRWIKWLVTEWHHRRDVEILY